MWTHKTEGGETIGHAITECLWLVSQTGKPATLDHNGHLVPVGPNDTFEVARNKFFEIMRQATEEIIEVYENTRSSDLADDALSRARETKKPVRLRMTKTTELVIYPEDDWHKVFRNVRKMRG